MKKYGAAVRSAGVVLTMLAMPLFAQHAELMKVSIPFNFVAENQWMEAGEYSIQPIVNGGLLIRSVDGKSVKTLLSLPLPLATTATASQIVFHRYGNDYFLTQLWMQGQNIGREVLTGRKESELARKGVPRHLASLAAH